jgi:putative selenate reductase
MTKAPDMAMLRKKKAQRQPGATLPEIGFGERSGFDMVIQTLDEATAQGEAARCLQCDEICSVCVSVCPNRANLEFEMKPAAFVVQQAVQGTKGVEIIDLEPEHIDQRYQILNIGDCCNECGNCATFCPTRGAPYQDKAKFHLTRESFDSARLGYHFTAENQLVFKNDHHQASLRIDSDSYTYESEVFKSVLNRDYSVRQVELKNGAATTVSLRPAAHMAILARAVQGVAPLSLR